MSHARICLFLFIVILPARGWAQEVEDDIEPLSELRALYDRVRPAVVRIAAGPAYGSGFVVGDGSRVVSAWHVVSMTDTIWIQTQDGSEHEATVERFDRKADVVVLELAEPLPDVAPLVLSPDVPRVGDTLYAVGHPLVMAKGPQGRHEGLLEWSLTAGMVSVVGEQQIQTTVSLQPGNSGGPVFDGAGRVVGVAVERAGDFGLARKVDVVADLMDSDDPPTRRPRVQPRLALGFGPAWLPEAGENRRFHFTLSTDLGIEIDHKLGLAVRADMGFLTNREEREAGRMGRQARLGLMVGPLFQTRPRSFKSQAIRFQPYFFAGLGVGASGTKSQTFEFLDPDCDPSLGPCEYDMAETKSWDRSYFPVVGGGLRLDVGGMFIDFGGTLSPLDPEGTATFGINFGIMAGRP